LSQAWAGETAGTWRKIDPPPRCGKAEATSRHGHGREVLRIGLLLRLALRLRLVQHLPELSPDPANQEAVKDFIAKLEAGKPVN